MLSYQHGYHAGNFADVHKHTALCLLLAHYSKQERLVTYIDTHSGRGLYELNGEQSLKTGEFREGISPFLDKPVKQSALKAYVEQVNSFGGQTYPGSPALIQKYLRANHRALFFELHPAEFDILQENFKEDKRIRCVYKDAHSHLIDFLPGRKGSGIILIDPSYEIKEDYETIARLAMLAHKRCPDFTIIVWYPMLPEKRHEQLKAKLKNTSFFELIGPEKDRGMYGTGLGIINPPDGFESSFRLGETEMFETLFKAPTS